MLAIQCQAGSRLTPDECEDHDVGWMHRRAGILKGPDCEKATRFLEEALDLVGQRIKKPDYHQLTATAA